MGEGRKWPVGLSRKPKEAVAFYAVLALSVALGVALNFTAINLIKALYWSALTGYSRLHHGFDDDPNSEEVSDG